MQKHNQQTVEKESSHKRKEIEKVLISGKKHQW